MSKEIREKKVLLSILNSILIENLAKNNKLYNDISLKTLFIQDYLNNTVYQEMLVNLKNKPVLYTYYILEKVLYQKKSDTFYKGQVCLDNENFYIVNEVKSENLEAYRIGLTDYPMIETVTVSKDNVKMLVGL